MSYKILLVEDDRWLAQLYQNALQFDPQCKVLHAEAADQALALLDDHPDIALIILDVFLPEHSGIEFLHEMASYNDINSIPVVMLTSVTKHDLRMNPERWQHYGVVEYLYKPTTKPADLVATVKKQLLHQAPAK